MRILRWMVGLVGIAYAAEDKPPIEMALKWAESGDLIFIFAKVSSRLCRAAFVRHLSRLARGSHHAAPVCSISSRTSWTHRL